MSLLDKITLKLLSDINPDIIQINSEGIVRSSFQKVLQAIVCKSVSHHRFSQEFFFDFTKEDSINLKTAIKDGLSNLYGKSLFSEYYAAISLPDTAFCHGTFQAPSVAVQTGLQPLLEREITNNTEMNYNDFIIRFEIGTRNGNMVTLHYCCLPKFVFNSVWEACNETGIVPVSIQPSYTGTSRLVASASADQQHPLVFLDLNYASVTAGVLFNGFIEQLQLINTGVFHLIERLQQDMGLSFKEAEIKIFDDLLFLDEPSDSAQLEISEYILIEPLLAELLQKIYGFLLLYGNDHTEHTGFSKIIISGAGATIKNFDRLISENLGIETIPLSHLLSQLSEPSINFDSVDNLKIEHLGSSLGLYITESWNSNNFERLYAA